MEVIAADEDFGRLPAVKKYIKERCLTEPGYQDFDYRREIYLAHCSRRAGEMDTLEDLVNLVVARGGVFSYQLKQKGVTYWTQPTQEFDLDKFDKSRVVMITLPDVA